MNLARGKCLKDKKFVTILSIAIVLVIGLTAIVISKADATAGITYRAHVAYNGWLDWKSDGATAGTVGESRRMEAIKMKLTGNMSGSVVYQAYVRDAGWQGEVKDGATAGTEGQSKQIEAIKVKLTGQVAESYNVTYRVHMKNKGWQGWVSNGAVAGSESERLRIEAIEVKLVKKEAPTGGQGNFTKYQFTDSQLKGIAALCQQEQGSAQGAAAEASLMANHLELRHNKAKNYEINGTGLYNYVRKSGWFAKAPYHMDNQGKLRPEVLNAVRHVLVDGKRTLPVYVDEHDCFSDISSATNDGRGINVKDRSAYVKNKTIMKNRYGSKYTFYCFPTAKSDPFGYTSEARRQKWGDFCYTYNAAEYEK